MTPARAAADPVTPQKPPSPARAADLHDTRGKAPVASDTGFGRAAAFTVLGTVVPGVGLIAARRRRSGFIVLAVFLIAVLTLAGWAVFDRQSLMASVVQPTTLHRIAVGLIVLAVLWVGVVVVTHLALRPRRPSRTHRVLGGLLVAVLAFAVAAPMAVAARISYIQAGTVNTIFKKEGDTTSATRPTMPRATKGQTDPWANTPRVNVLLLGGDAGSDRTGTRTDTVIVASIDTSTGNTVLISLPRNTARMPFPKDSPLHKYYPHGFTNGNGDDAEFFLNAMYDNVPANVPKDVLGKTDNLGADAMKLSAGEATGLKIDYYVLIDFRGFKQMVDALGGITVNINTYVAVGGRTDLHQPPERWLKPGANQHLDGEDALWFARGRYGADDFQRMDRQRCVINAIIDQANPANLLTRYEKIAQAGKDIVQTDMPQEVLPMMVDLGTRVKGGNVRSLVFKNGVAGFSSPRPDFALMRSRVKASLGEATKDTSTKKPSSSSTTAPSKGSTTGQSSESTADACAFQPSVAATATIPQ
ncbi:MAG: LCP family protein [Propionibacteriaceae bacterium]